MRCDNCPAINNGQFHRERVLLREWDLWYFVAPSMSVGVNWIWYDASNLTTGNGSAQDQIFNKQNARSGAGRDRMNVILNWRYTFFKRNLETQTKREVRNDFPFFWCARRAYT